VIVAPEIGDRQLDSPLGRASPLMKLAVGLVWLGFLLAVVDPRPALVLILASAAGCLGLGRVPLRRFARAWVPFLLAALGVLLVNTVLGAANLDPANSTLLRVGPLRVTGVALAVGVALGLRVLAVAAVGVAFALTTEATRLADALVQQARIPERFAAGALAAHQAVPRLTLDLATLHQARRIRGLRGDWHPRLLMALLILAVRRAGRVALAMDARGFALGTPPSRYRVVAWSWADLVVGAAGLAALALAALSVALPPPH
jgi:energy-coupling factor transport system permease protein